MSIQTIKVPVTGLWTKILFCYRSITIEISKILDGNNAEVKTKNIELSILHHSKVNDIVRLIRSEIAMWKWITISVKASNCFHNVLNLYWFL